ncbi:Protein AIM2 [Candida viswanathii]|uniref:Protein AIM2 n=1 Tax=Candida viswanathii TaxID=5486 RepID=A0A367YFW1_9ASCO|nr:Protein AIM2 [Candida viswanathii]
MTGLKDCCFKKFDHEGVYKGGYQEVAGLDSYVIGEPSDNVIVILTDIYGYKFNNARLLADDLNELTNLQVIIPDILLGDPVDPVGVFKREEWFAKHHPGITSPIVTDFLTKLREEKHPKKVFGIGYCFGAKFVVQNLGNGGLLDVGAVAHPSLLTVEEIDGISNPVLISTGEADAAFGPELRTQTIESLSKSGVRFQVDIFQGATHGYAVKGDLTNPVIKYAKEKTLLDQAYWFSQF